MKENVLNPIPLYTSIIEGYLYYLFPLQTYTSSTLYNQSLYDYIGDNIFNSKRGIKIPPKTEGGRNGICATIAEMFISLICELWIRPHEVPITSLASVCFYRLI